MNSAAKKLRMVAVTTLLLSASLAAQMGPRQPRTITLPPNLSEVRIEQKLDAQLPLDAQFRDEQGNTVKLDQYFHKTGRPVLLNLVYFECPTLCTETLNGVTSMMRALKLNAGSDFEVLTVSFDHREGPELAAAKKKAYLERYNRPGASNGWHFLTGDKENIKRLTDAVGFQFMWEERTQQWAHATALILLTPEGHVAQYYYGVEYPPKDVRLGLVEASQNKIGNLVDEVLLYCFHYDPRTGRYGAVISNILKLSGAATTVLLGGFIFIMVRRERKNGPNFARER